ncbi:TetR/AcrR family transcriptional regulator [Streptomyces sp. NEAU-PBA10]|uniref:TetR/AcrR family transcriptional regulator n=1 Tax=Streptomyces TaxID=1883 RepID=UPI00189CC6EB|nr:MULTISPECIES: helix-turn-helix domain-containing protein [Streptomyces]UDF09480.1 TetR/AcrR family transcriptional regulator [Streptomyces sp. WA1-19]
MARLRATDDLRQLPLRERMKLRTRQAPAETALRLFTERGHDATTLDGLYDAVEVSQCTLIRNYRTKEDVALAPDSDLWSAYLDLLAIAEPTRPLLGVLRAAPPRTTLDAMSPDWDGRFRTVRELSESVPAPQAHSLGYRQDTTRALVSTVYARADGQGDEVRLRLTVEIFVAAWRITFLFWTGRRGAARRPGRARGTVRCHLRRASGKVHRTRQRSPNRPDPRRRGRAR